MTNKCNMMIFGATGDLTYQKLLPAIFDLYKENELCEHFKLICVGRRHYDLNAYLNHLDDKYKSQLSFQNFKQHIVYHQLDFTDQEAFKSLKVYDFNKNWIFYLATAPKYFSPLTETLKNHALLDESHGFKRIVFEKPFGVNFQDAKTINKHIGHLLEESQIYRIDHYLGKEMIQNILLTRAYNNFIEMLWHKDAIESFEVVISEAEGVKNRGAYYDQSGALKDMVQNHMFQIVALLAMDLPEVLIPETIREKKTAMLKKLVVTDENVFGQYEGYREEKAVPVESTTETFVAMKLFVDHKRWKGVPFYIKTGKALSEKHAHVVVRFKQNKGNVADNILMIEIQPEEGIYLQMNSKRPGISNEVTRVTMDYCHSCLKYGSEPSAYGRLLLDVMVGDKSLFASWAEIETSWQIIDQVEKIKNQQNLVYYEKGSKWDQHVLLEKGWWVDD